MHFTHQIVRQKNQSGDDDLIHIWHAITADGSAHQLAPTSGAFETIDATGIRLERATGTLIDRDGVRYAGAVNGPFASTWTDPNGNQISVNSSNGWTDTMGRLIPGSASTDTGFTVGVPTSDLSSCPAGTLSARVWNLPAANSGTSVVKLCYANFGLQTNFGVPWVQEAGPGAVPLLSAIVLPNLTMWQFSYNNFLDLTSITFPTGGSITYTWGNSPNAPNPAAPMTRVLTSRTINANDGTGPHTWNYQWSQGSNLNLNVVTDPLGNDTTNLVAGDVVIESKRYAGSYTTGTLLETTTTQYRSDENPFDVYVPAHAANVVPLSVTTTIFPSGKTSQSTYNYDPGFTYSVYNIFDGSTSTYPAIYGGRALTTASDYGQGVPGPVVNQTSTTYQWQNNPNYQAANLLDLPASVVEEDGPGNRVAETDYTYDDPNRLVGANIGTQHVAQPGPVRGNLSSVSKWLNTTGCNPQAPGSCPTSYSNVYDTGEVYQSTDPLGNTTTFTYDPAFVGAYVTKTQLPDTAGNGAAIHHITSGNYDFNTGLLTSLTDQNNNTTSYSYDNIGRITGVTYPDTGHVTNCYTDVGGATCSQTGPPYQVVTTQTINFSVPAKKSTSVTDGLGRVVQTQLNSDPDGETHVDTTYDPLGRVQSVSNPYRPATESTHGITQHQYDPLGRETQIIEPDNSTVTTDYSQFPSVTVTDEAGRQRRNQTDALGRLLTVWEPDDNGNLSYETDYYYNALDNLEHVVQKGNDPSSANWRQRDFAYDSLSRLTFANNPESGPTYYGYDANGNLTSKISPMPNQTGASQIQFLYHYDELNRLVWRWNYSQPSDPVDRFYYDLTTVWNTPIHNSIGRLVQSVSDSGNGIFVHAFRSYDAMGRPEFDVEYNKRGDYSVHKQFNYAYNLDSSLQSITYPSGRVVTYNYNAAQRPISAVDSANGISFATAAHYFAFGGLGYVVHGATSSFGGIVESENYNVRMQPNELGAAVGNQPPLLDLIYEYYSCNGNVGNNGNVCQVLNQKDSARSQAFAYDYLNRLVWAWTPNLNSGGAHNWGESFGYDAWGNFLHKNTMGSDNPPDTSLDVTVDNKNHVTSWTYDAAGNIIDPKPQPCSNPPNPTPSGYPNFFDGQNRLTQALVGCLTTYYDYDAEGERVKKTGSDGTLYWRGPGGEVLEETDLNGNLQSDYIFFGGERTARVDSSGAVYYYFSDHLGSADVITDPNGNIQAESDYYPFGGERVVIDLGVGNHYKFTGKERDAETGCDYFGARYYCNPIGRFITPDWAGAPTEVPYANFGNPQSLNLYSYVKNNPTTFGDPDGHCDGDDCQNIEVKAELSRQPVIQQMRSGQTDTAVVSGEVTYTFTYGNRPPYASRPLSDTMVHEDVKNTNYVNGEKTEKPTITGDDKTDSNGQVPDQSGIGHQEHNPSGTGSNQAADYLSQTVQVKNTKQKLTFKSPDGTTCTVTETRTMTNADSHGKASSHYTLTPTSPLVTAHAANKPKKPPTKRSKQKKS
jgi:RHS repeat-associated protein